MAPAAAPAAGIAAVSSEDLVDSSGTVGEDDIVVFAEDRARVRPRRNSGVPIVGTWLARGWNRFIALSLHPNDDYEQQLRKRTIVSCATPLCLFLLMSLIADTFTVLGNLMSAEIPAMGTIKTVPLWGIVYILLNVFVTKRLPRSHVQAFIWTIGLMIILSDWAGHNEGETSAYYGIWTPTWPVAFLVMDASLVSKLGALSEVALLCVFVVWLVLRSLEECYRYGVWDVPLTVNRTDTYHMCPEDGGACAKECSALTFVHVMLRTVLVISVDFVVTRGFREQANAAIVLAEDVSAAMVRFDLEEANEQLEEAQGAPWRLRQGFRNLIDNLHRYRPFLPDALFESETEEEEHGETQSMVSGSTAGSPSGVRMLGAAPSRGSVLSLSRSTSATSARSEPSDPRRSTAAGISHRSSAYEKAQANAKKNDRVLQAMQMGLAKKHVVVVSSTVRPWDWTTQAASAEVDSICASWLETTYTAGKTAKATILGIRGQQATLVWGSLAKVPITAACIKAAGCVTSVLRTLGRPLPHGARAHCGLGVGAAQCGNQGSAEFREHCLIGSLCGTVRALCLFSEFAKVGAVLDKPSATNIENEYDVRQIDRFHWISEAGDSEHDPLPKGYRPFDVYELQKPKETKANDEWMYQLEEEEARKKGLDRHFDDGARALFDKHADYPLALEAFSRHLKEAPDDTVALRLRAAAACASCVCSEPTYARRAWRHERWQTFAVPIGLISPRELDRNDSAPREPERSGSILAEPSSPRRASSKPGRRASLVGEDPRMLTTPREQLHREEPGGETDAAGQVDRGRRGISSDTGQPPGPAPDPPDGQPAPRGRVPKIRLPLRDSKAPPVPHPAVPPQQSPGTPTSSSSSTAAEPPGLG
eukprot:TRINITY_DN3679_c1_g1_i1.p1 TRINITY_DN3679_c1_g1~~TRINITY_DN3679_c1_g1_i1.p1  ORF type:complete len:876 (+),score=233.30 TRINITY_DN3679_c1_g1_i1:88-2715(+)